MNPRDWSGHIPDPAPTALLRALGALMNHHPGCRNATSRKHNCTCRPAIGTRP